MQAYRAFKDPELAERAASSYREAVKRFPADGLLRAHLAWAQHLAGDQEKAAQDAAEALRLNELNPYQDRRFEYEKVRLSGDPQVSDKPPIDLMRQLLPAKN